METFRTERLLTIRRFSSYSLGLFYYFKLFASFELIANTDTVQVPPPVNVIPIVSRWEIVVKIMPTLVSSLPPPPPLRPPRDLRMLGAARVSVEAQAWAVTVTLAVRELVTAARTTSSSARSRPPQPPLSSTTTPPVESGAPRARWWEGRRPRGTTTPGWRSWLAPRPAVRD